MTIFEKEETITDGNRWCPCTPCSKSDNCKQECLRFKEYVHTQTVRERKENFMHYLKSQRNGIAL